MTMREVLIKALEIAGGEPSELEGESKKKDKLLKCADMIYQELTAEYAKLKHQEKIWFEKGRAYYAAFSKKVKDITSVCEDRSGRKVCFKIRPFCVEADINGYATVNYLYHPDEAGMDDELELPPQYTPHVLALGVASEYFYRQGLIEEALFYRNRYDVALLNLSRRRQGITLKKGG